MDSRKCQASTVTPPESGIPYFGLIANSLKTSGPTQIICKQYLVSQTTFGDSLERPIADYPVCWDVLFRSRHTRLYGSAY